MEILKLWRSANLYDWEITSFDENWHCLIKMEIVMYVQGWVKQFKGWLKKLCHINEIWHALNSTFPDNNCIISFQINQHWISNSGLWKVVLETAWKTDHIRESCFTRIMLLHTSLWLQWLLSMTVALYFIYLFIYLFFPFIGWIALSAQSWFSKLIFKNMIHCTDLSPSIFSWFDTIWLFSLLQHEKMQYLTNDEVISAVEDFLEDQDESFYTTGIQALQHL